MRSRVLLAGCILSSAVLVAGPADAATTSVAIENFAFGPASVTVVQGGTVTWRQDDAGTVHTVTSTAGFWDSGDLVTGQTYSQAATFKNAGTYVYRCMHHTDMTGRVQVPIAATGTASTGWQLRWSSLTSTPSSRAFDVQIKRPGSSTWAAFRTDTSGHTAFFNPRTNGTYAFRARTRNVSSGRNSGWSPVRQVRIS